MEVKINREIRDYSEAVYFGLNLRQFVFSVLACGVAVGLYFLLKPFFGIETLSWVCILGAAPFAAIGFFQYHGMSAEKALIVYLKSEILMPKELKYEKGCDFESEHRSNVLLKELNKALNELSPYDRRICELVMQGYSGNKIAAIIGMPRSSYKLYWKELRKTLYLRLNGFYYDE